jgi:hypothetical protein
MKHILIAVVIVLLLVGCVCDPAIIGSQPVTLRPQEQSNWCWAASGQMVMEFHGHNVSQCTQANNRLGRNDCCNDPTPGACNSTGWPEFDKYDFSFLVTSNTALTWDQVTGQIYCSRRPIAFSWHWNGGGGHMMVLLGYVTLEGVNYVTINDPWAPNVGDQRIITYDHYVSGAGYTHWNDYYNIRYTGD